MNFRKVIQFTFLFVLGCVLISCKSYKKVPYLQSNGSEFNATSSLLSSIARYQTDDVLGITVNTSGDPSVAADFNLPMQPSATTDNTDEWKVDQGLGRQTYRVNQRGEIDFPVLGRIQVAGLCQDELEDQLKQSLRTYLKTDPIVTIRLMNYKISVLGEVNNPGQYGVSKDHINILEALSLAGDMTIHGRRENIQLTRIQPSGELKIVKLDLTNTEITKSPYFFLKQNDVLYVEPNSAKAKSSDISSQTGILISIGSMLLAIVNLIVLIQK